MISVMKKSSSFGNLTPAFSAWHVLKIQLPRTQQIGHPEDKNNSMMTKITR
jgi:hypothetical protein